MDERAEIIAWATRNRQFLRGKAAADVAYFARLNDFSAGLVYEIFSHWSPQSGLDMRFREAFAVGSEIHYLESLNPLYDSWKCLGEYLLEGKEWAA